MSDGTFASLNGKRVLITGSSRGIGKAIAEGFARNGASVSIHCTRPCERADETITELSRYGTKVVGVYGDLSLSETPHRIYKEAKALLGGIDILICNASLQIRSKWTDITEEDYTKQMKINVLSTLVLSQLAAVDMVAAKKGRIVTIGSVQQIKPHPDMLVYSASKSAVANMVASMALQLAEYNITVNNVAPGTIYTDRNSSVLADDEYKKNVINDIPSKFIGSADDCTDTVLMLCSDGGRYINGENIYVDGGKHI